MDHLYCLFSGCGCGLISTNGPLTMGELLVLPVRMAGDGTAWMCGLAVYLEPLVSEQGNINNGSRAGL